MDGQGRSRKDCRKLSWSPRKTLAFSRNLFFTNSFSIPWSKIKTWKLMTIRTLCFSSTSSPTIVRISSPTAPTSPPWKNAQGKNYAFGDDLPSGCQGARTTLHGSSSAPAPNTFFISDDIFQYFRRVSNSAIKHVWSLWAWFQTECLLDHLDVQLKFAGAVFIFPDFDWGSPTHINTAINRVFTW